ncbi:MAG: MFS transporter, partial [Pseudonocardiaceae bacterium]
MTAGVRNFPLAVRLLLVNQFVGNTGFYLLIPFLSDYLLDDLGLSAAVVGVVLGVRNLSQQGLFLVGGSAADRLGARGVIITGLGIRAAGFGLFAIAESLPVVLLASVLTGFAGALFSPAVRAYLAQDAGDHRAEAFALFNVFGNVGMTAGPLLGIWLVQLGFPITAMAATGIFALLTLAQLAVLPARRVEPTTTTVLGDWAQVAANRRFWAFSCALMGMFALQSQVYFVLALQAEQVTGPRAEAVGIAALFTASTVVSILFQIRVTRSCQRVLARGQAMALGLSVMGLAFLAPLAGTPLTRTVSGDGPARGGDPVEPGARCRGPALVRSHDRPAVRQRTDSQLRRFATDRNLLRGLLSAGRAGHIRGQSAGRGGDRRPGQQRPGMGSV